jgi:uncharacterized iron-regulated membrane protein
LTPAGSRRTVGYKTITKYDLIGRIYTVNLNNLSEHNPLVQILGQNQSPFSRENFAAAPRFGVRTVLFWAHLSIGVTAGLVILLISATGVLLTYQRQLIEWSDRVPAARSPSAGATPLGMDELLARLAASASHPPAPFSVAVRNDPDAPVVVSAGADVVLLINTYTGAVIGDGGTLRPLFRAITDWHRWIGRAPGQARDVARSVTGAANLAFFVLLLSGSYLWLPRVWSWRAVRPLVWFRWAGTARARHFNWHHVVALWCFVPLIVIIASGVVMSYGWANALVYRVAGETPPAVQARPTPDRSAARNDPAPASSTSVDAAWNRAKAFAPADWETLTLRTPGLRDVAVTVTIDSGTGGQPQRRGQLTLDRATGTIVKWEPFSSNSPGRRLRTYLRFGHTGEVFGLAGQTIAGLASLGAVALGYTGLSLAFRRLRARV